MRIVEAWGTGLPRIINRCKEYELPEPLFEQCGIGVPFGQTNVMEWLNCSKSKAMNIMNAMKAANIIKKVTGLGPGKYEFVEVA